jgi:predicted DNA-binding transcriptional regulator AlpA
MEYKIANLPDEAQVSVQVVAQLFGAGVSTIWARVKKNELPTPNKYGRSTRWRLGDIREILAGGAA